MKKSRIPAASLAALLLLAALPQAAHAAAGTWNVDANGTWSSAGNWTPGIADGSGFAANFTNNITADRTVSLDSARTLGSLVFGDTTPATAGSWILNNNGNAANTLTGLTAITANALGTGKTATISAVIAGSASRIELNGSGGGTLVLAGANTFNFTTNNSNFGWRLNVGSTVVVASDSAFGVTTGTDFNATTLINLNGGTLQAGGSARTVANPIWLNGSTTVVSGSQSLTFSGAAMGRGGNPTVTNNITGGGTLSFTGKVYTDQTTGFKILTFNGTGNTLISGVIANNTTGAAGQNGSIAKSGAGKLTLSGANTYTGTTAVSTGTLLVNSPGSLHASSAVSVADTAILGGSGTINGTVTVSAGGTILLGASSATLTLAKSTAPTYNFSGSNYSKLKILASASTLDKVSSSATTGNVANVDLIVDTTGLTGNVSSTTIYSAGGAITGPFRSVTVIGNSAYTPTVDYSTSGQIKLALTGITPIITTSGTLSALSTTYGTASSTTSFTVSGADMTAGITVTPPAGFEVSKTVGGASDYAGSGTAITVGAAGAITSTTVYVRLAATATVGSSPYSGNITCVSSGATTQNVATASSTVSKATPTATLEVTNSPVAYTGSAQAATVGITTSSPAGGSVTSISTGGAATQTASGTYAVTADYVPADTTNYNSLTGLSAGNFIILDANTFTVTFNNNGGTGTMTPQPGSTAANLTANTFTQTGYTFAGWNTASDNSGTAYADSASYPFTASTTLFAQWTANTYTVTFDGNSGETPSPTSKSVTYDSTYGTLATVTRTGYTFNGWFTATSGGTQVTSASTVAITAAQTLYAQWTINTYTVTFDGNQGGTPSPTSKSVTYDSTYGTLATVTRTGYAFNGWFTATSEGTQVTSASPVTITAAQTLYAQWTAVPTIILADTLVAVSTTYGTASATPTSFRVSGSNLTGAPGNLTVTPPSGYEVSLSSGSGYSTSLSVPYSSDTLASTQIYVRLAATAGVAGSPYSGNITVSGGGASSQTLATASSTVAKAAATVVVTPYTVTYDGNPQTATVTPITGVNGETGATVGTVTLNTTHTNAGTYASDSWSFTGTANYNNIGNTISTIAVANGSFETTGSAVSGPWFTFGSPWSITNSPSPYQVIQAVNGGAFSSTAAGGGTYIGLVNGDDCPITAPLTQNLGVSVTAGDTLTVTFQRGNPLISSGGAGVAYFDVAGTKYTMPFNTTGMAASTWQLTTMTQTITNSGNLTLGFYGTTGNGVNVWVDLVSNVSRTSSGTPQTLTNTINPKALSITAPTIAAKNYNGTATAGAVTVGTLSGFVGTETVTATGVATNYPSANANTYPETLVSYTLENGTNSGLAANYSLATGTATGVINKVTPTATLAVNNSPVTYDGTPKAATLTLSVNSVPGTLENILTGGAATQTAAGTYAVTADFVPTDTANYNTLTSQSAGNFVIVTTYNAWAAGTFTNAFTDQDPTHDPDSDGLTNLQEYAFGTDPTNGSSGPSSVTYANGVIASNGQPTTRVTNITDGVDFRAVFGRRKDYVNAGLTYTVQFSAGMDVWVDSTATPEVLASDATMDAVSVPYPFFIITSRGVEKPTFFRVAVSSN